MGGIDDLYPQSRRLLPCVNVFCPPFEMQILFVTSPKAWIFRIELLCPDDIGGLGQNQRSLPPEEPHTPIVSDAGTDVLA